MPGKLNVEFDSPTHGWIQQTLTVEGQELCIVSSCVPYDSLKELADALCGVAGQISGLARWNSEPDEYDLVFEVDTARGTVHLVVNCYPEGKRLRRNAREVFSHVGPTVEVCRTFFRALRKLESRFDQTQWRFPFPKEGVSVLGAALRNVGSR